MNRRAVSEGPFCSSCIEDGKPDPSPTGRKIFENCGVIFSAKKWPSEHHIYHAKNHVLTIKEPRSAPAFLQNLLQKASFPAPKKITAGPE
jgi:hypothetical protein